MKLKGLTLFLWMLMSQLGYTQDAKPLLIAYDSVLGRISKLISGVDTFALTPIAEIREDNASLSLTEECADRGDSLVVQRDAALAALEASRKVGKDLRMMVYNRDSVINEKDKVILFKGSQIKGEREIASFYRRQKNSWTGIAIGSIVINALFGYMLLKN